MCTPTPLTPEQEARREAALQLAGEALADVREQVRAREAASDITRKSA